MLHLKKSDLQKLEKDLVKIWESLITEDAPELGHLQYTIVSLPSFQKLEPICSKRTNAYHVDGTPDVLNLYIEEMQSAYFDENAMYYLAHLIRELRKTITDLGIFRVEWFNIDE